MTAALLDGVPSSVIERARAAAAALAAARAVPAPLVIGPESPAFKAWFAGSKVVDADGNPLRVFHGTSRDFNAFERKPAHRRQDGLDSIGSWFTDNSVRAQDYGSTVMPVYLSMKRPLIVESFDDLRDMWADAQPRKGEAAKAHKANRHHGSSQAFLDEWDALGDGIIIKQHGSGEWADQTAYIVFRPEQIKSATGNSGAFDPTKASIFDAAGEVAPHEAINALVARLATATPHDRVVLAAEIIAKAGAAALPTARAFFRATLQDTTVATVIGDVRLIGGTFKEMRRGMKHDGLKAALIPHVPDILARGEYHGRETLNKARDDDHAAFHFFSLAGIEVAGFIVDAGVTVVERAPGEFEYRLTAYGLGHSNEARWQKRIGGTLVRGQEPRVVPPIGPAEPTLDAIVEENDMDGNITILSATPVGWAVFDGFVSVSTPLLDYTDSPVLATILAELVEVIERHEHATGRDRLVLAARVRLLTARVERRRNLQPVKLQNRDRSTAASIAQVQSIGKNPDPDLLGYNKTPTEGAPIVFADYDEMSVPAALLGRKATVTFTKDMSKAPVRFAVVPAEDVMVSHDFNGAPVEGYDALEAPEGKLRAVAGNGRAAGIQLAYAKGTAARYMAGLIEEAEMLQLDEAAIAALAHPMLVRIMRHEDVTADIGDKTNSSGMAAFSAVEQAKTDADRVDFANLTFSEDGTPTLDALHRFVQSMPLAEQAALAPDGTPTNQALDRLMAATFRRAYEDDDLVKLYSQSLDPEIKNVLYGMAQAAGDMAALAGHGEYDIRGFVTGAASMASNAKRAGLPLSRMAEQRDIGMPEEANDLAALFARHVRSAKKIGDALRNLARAALAEAESDGEDMFGPVEKRPPGALVAAAVEG